MLADGRQLRILNSHIHSIGGYGVSLNGGNQRTLEPAENEVVNCEIHDFGWREKSQIPGVIVDGVQDIVSLITRSTMPHTLVSELKEQMMC